MDAAVGDVHRWGRSLAEFDTDPVLKLGLKRIDETLKETLALVESRRARATAAMNEMYLVLSFFLVFQGGVMNLLASKANASKCNYAWYPAALSTVAFLAVLGVVHDKFRDYHDLKRKRQNAESAANVCNPCNSSLPSFLRVCLMFCRVSATCIELLTNSYLLP